MSGLSGNYGKTALRLIEMGYVCIGGYWEIGHDCYLVEWDMFVSVDIGNLDMIVILSLEFVW
jgi:hypothetical protein